jgi:hypothetical protein
MPVFMPSLHGQTVREKQAINFSHPNELFQISSIGSIGKRSVFFQGDPESRPDHIATFS